jgi:hypothetical protein
MRSALLAALGLVAGCLTDAGDRLTVQINFQIVEPLATPEPPVITVVGNGVGVQHRFQTPTPCHSFQGSATQSGERIELVLRLDPDRTAECPAEETEWAYNALINGAKPGATRIAITIGQSREEYTLPRPTS